MRRINIEKMWDQDPDLKTKNMIIKKSLEF